jgi:hypothetical protein
MTQTSAMQYPAGALGQGYSLGAMKKAEFEFCNSCTWSLSSFILKHESEKVFNYGIDYLNELLILE